MLSKTKKNVTINDIIGERLKLYKNSNGILVLRSKFSEGTISGYLNHIGEDYLEIVDPDNDTFVCVKFDDIEYYEFIRNNNKNTNIVNSNKSKKNV